MRGTLPAARKQQRYVAARTRFVGFARRGARACSRAAAGSDLFRTSAQDARGTSNKLILNKTPLETTVEFVRGFAPLQTHT